jgi:hypothetical protein
MNKKTDDYKVIFRGATISKRESNKVGVAFIFGAIGAFLIYFIFGVENKTLIFTICLILSFVGYFGIANRIFKEPEDNKKDQSLSSMNR